MKGDIRPTEDRVLVRPLEDTEQLPAGLVMPDSYRDNRGRGVAEAVGPGARTRTGARVPMTVAVGDQVLYPKAAGVAVPGDNADRVLLRESEILAVLS